MSIFEDVTLAWDGKEYTVPANKVMMLIAKVEDVITLGQLSDPANIKMTQLALAFQVALKYAGADADHDEVYASLFDMPEDGDVHPVTKAVTDLQMMLVPPSTYKPQETAKTGKPKAKAKPKAKSKPRSK